MGVKYISVAVIVVAITLFALQNTAPTSIRFLIWGLKDVPLATVILVSVASGIVLVGVPLWFDRWRLRARARSLEGRLERVEARLGERTRTPGASPPAP